MEYASKGVAGAGLGLGIAGTALGLLGNGWGPFNNGMASGQPNCYVTNHTLDMAMAMARQDSEIALLKAERDENEKIADVYERLITRINADQRAQSEINTHQAVYNTANNAGLQCLKAQVAQLYRLTELKIPNESITPGWGDVEVTPVPPTAG